jgi:hypothetical protein
MCALFCFFFYPSLFELHYRRLKAMFGLPARQLNSTRIKNSLRANLLGLVSEHYFERNYQCFNY